MVDVEDLDRRSDVFPKTMRLIKLKSKLIIPSRNKFL